MSDLRSKDQRFHSYLSPTAAKEYWTVRLVKDVSPEAALMEAVANLERGQPIQAERPEDVVCNVKGEPIGVVPLDQR